MKQWTDFIARTNAGGWRLKGVRTKIVYHDGIPTLETETVDTLITTRGKPSDNILKLHIDINVPYTLEQETDRRILAIPIDKFEELATEIGDVDKTGRRIYTISPDEAYKNYL
ncbi:MAG: hypothetical protein FWF71_04095 [Actinomycetia bacterium]|nr:hypothetical protein [Actinomycetes bacterium]